MRRRLPAAALLLALAAPTHAGVISGYDPASQTSHDTYDRFASGFPTLVRDHADQEIRHQVLRKPYRAAELCQAIEGLLDTVG